MKQILAVAATICTLIATSTFAANGNINSDIKQIRNSPLVKGELETTAEFDVRTQSLYQKYSGRTYRLEVSAKSSASSEHKFLTYNPDNEELTVSLPPLDSKLLWVPKDNDEKIGHIYFSFLETDSPSIKSDSYIGKNGFGKEVRVERHIVNVVGVAILGSADEDMTPQQFKTNISREKVRDLLKNWRLVIELRSDLQKLEKEPSLLIVDEDESEPSMRRPIHVKRTKYMLPVRLVTISLLDGKGNRVLDATGTEQDTVSLEIDKY